MNNGVKRGAAAPLLIALLSTVTVGCAAYGSGAQPPSVRNDPPPDLAYNCQLANRDVLVRSSMPSLRGRCNAWTDRQTGVLGF